MRFCFLLALLVFILALTPPARAQTALPVIQNGPGSESPLPTGLQGLWSWPDCTDGKSLFVLAPDYILFSRQDMNKFGAISHWRQEEGIGGMLYNYETNNGGFALLKQTNDGRMKVLFVRVHPKAPLKSSWGPSMDQTAREFTHCAKLFDNTLDLGQAEISAPFKISAAYKSCKGVSAKDFPTATACHAALFHVADSNNDQKLDHAELMRLYKQVAFAYASSVYCGGIAYPADSATEAKAFATAALGTKEEINLKDVVALLKDPAFIAGSGQKFWENAHHLQVLLPFLPAPLVETGCPLSAPGDARDLGTVPLPDTAQALPRP